MSQKNNTIAEKTNELSELVAWFDSNDFDIEVAVEKYKEAEKLASSIEKDLLQIKNEIKIIKQKFDEEA